MKKASVYTRTGDAGMTSLCSGERMAKCSPRVDAYGNIDEINSALAMARATVKRKDVAETIYKVQKMMLMLMADVASLNLPEPYITHDHVVLLEQTIDTFDAMLKPLTAFITPGDTLGGAALDMARTVTRRAERALLKLASQEEVNKEVLLCLNRLSDLCFILERVETEVGEEK